MKKYLIIMLILSFVFITSLVFIYRKPSNVNILPTENNITIEETKEKIPESNTLEVENIVPSENIETNELEAEVETIVPSTEKVIEDHNTSTKPTSPLSSPTSSSTTSSTPSSPPITKNTQTKVEEKQEIKQETKIDETIEVKPEETIKPSTSNETENISQNETPPIETKNEIMRCTDANNHGIEVGNTGKWFSTKDEAIAYYKSEIKKWSDEWEAADPDDAEANKRYYENCPTGYNVFSCMYCSKWTINFYYRK